MLLPSYRYRLVNISCLPNSTQFNALVDFDRNVASVFPYLNAIIGNCSYNSATQLLDFMENGHIITIGPNHMKVTGIDDEEQAVAEIKRLQDLINRTWEARAEIEPINERVAPVTPLEVLRYLPRTNCGLCDEPTCMAFAARLCRRAAEPEACPELTKAEHASKAQALADLFGRKTRKVAG
jgi:ArsR family metal-binding transcriptional regulator